MKRKAASFFNLEKTIEFALQGSFKLIQAKTDKNRKCELALTGEIIFVKTVALFKCLRLIVFIDAGINSFKFAFGLP